MYEHFDPETNETLYVGRGSGQRAWACTGGYAESKYGNRSRVHMERLKRLMSLGFLPCDWVRIIDKGLENSQALFIEQREIRSRIPKYNRPIGLKLCKMSWDDIDIEIAIGLRGQRKSYRDIGRQLGVSTMVVFRALNGKTKNRVRAA